MLIDSKRLYKGDIYQKMICEDGTSFERLVAVDQILLNVGNKFVEMKFIDCRANYRYFMSHVGAYGCVDVDPSNSNLFLSQYETTYDGLFVKDVESLYRRDNGYVGLKTIESIQKQYDDYAAFVYRDVPDYGKAYPSNKITPIEMMSKQAEDKMVR